HSWSIAIEEHFYLALPLLLWLLVRKDRLRWLPWICAAVCVIELAARCVRASVAGATWQDLYFPTHYRVDSLMFGVLLGHLHHAHRDAFVRFAARAWPALGAAALGALVFAATFDLDHNAVTYTVGFTILYLG